MNLVATRNMGAITPPPTKFLLEKSSNHLSHTPRGDRAAAPPTVRGIERGEGFASLWSLLYCG